MDGISEVRLRDIYPALAEKVRKMAEILAGDSITIRVVQGLRTWGEQQALYEQGRSRSGKIVTNCPAGHSYHNFGLAVDCCPSLYLPGEPFAADWNASHPTWQRMETVGQSLGLDSGATWRTFKDAPHFQLTGRFPEGSPPDEVRDMFHSFGMQTVWDAVTKSLS